MIEQKYPIGVQSFSKIIKEGYTYVDKTRYIKPLLSQGSYIFLSRPRRFGKSLFLSTLRSYFEGERELFAGLDAYDLDLDWTPSPVLYFDFNNGFYQTSEGLLSRLHASIEQYELQYGLPVGARNEEEITVRFERLIKAVHDRSGKSVVILVDEYDKPLLELSDNSGLFEKNQRLLKSFYSNFKSMDAYIRFVMITGVARFAKVSIFSDLNNLDDISMESAFADICGWTEQELTDAFSPGIERLAAEREETCSQTLDILRNYYDGYMFAPKGNRLYNPFSVLRALKAKELDAYWFDSGTPTILAKWVKANGIAPEKINDVIAMKEDLISVGFDSNDPIPLMFQTGYLTIGRYDMESGLFHLRFPNREVELGFFKKLLPLYAPQISHRGSSFEFGKFKQALSQGKIEEFMQRLSALLKDIPGEDHCEAVYRAISYLLAVLSGTYAIAEHHGYQGHSDLEVLTTRFVYLFEFKYNKSVDAAMKQLLSRDYAGRYAMDSRQVYLIAANFSEKKATRGLHYEIRPLPRP